MTLAPRLTRLARVVERLEGEQPYVTREQLVAALGKGRWRLDEATVLALLERAVADLLLFRDRRTLYDVASNTFRDTHLYRVNYGHAFFRAQEMA